MNKAQRNRYWGVLWPDACQVQKWHPKDEDRRRDVTFAATGQESTSKLSEDQITLLFNKLKWLADPHNFEKAYADANPEIALEENKREKVIFRIQATAARKGFNEGWLVKASEHKCARHRVSCWRKLPMEELINFSKTVTSRKGEAAPVQDGCTGVVDPDDIVF